MTERLSILAGVGTWAVIGIPALVAMVDAPGRLAVPAWWTWWVAYLAFGAIFIMVTTGRWNHWSVRAHRIVLAVQTSLAAAAIVAVPDYGLTAILLIMTASHAAHTLPLAWGVGWVGLQSVFLGWHNLRTYDRFDASVVQTLAYVGFQLFALLMTDVALRESRSRRELARVNAELEATQKLLEASSRARERLRIARELHDLLGHHLTALILNLDVAARVSEGKAREPVTKAHALAKLLMADVRGAVSQLREDERLGLRPSLEALAASVPHPQVHVTVDDDLALTDLGAAHVILRCAQEAITNAVKHADADHVWIHVERDGDEIAVHARDDGRGAAHVRHGNGLQGMRERVEGAGGRMRIHTSPGGGFALEAWLPAGGS